MRDLAFILVIVFISSYMKSIKQENNETNVATNRIELTTAAVGNFIKGMTDCDFQAFACEKVQDTSLTKLFYMGKQTVADASGKMFKCDKSSRLTSNRTSNLTCMARSH